MAVAFTRSNVPGTEEATLFYGNERDPDAISIKEDNKTAAGASKALFVWETSSHLRRRILQALIAGLGVVIIAVIICAFTLKDSSEEYTYLGKARFRPEDKKIEFSNVDGKFVLSGEIGIGIKSTLTNRHTNVKSRFKYSTNDGVWLVLTETDSSILVNWTSTSETSMVFLDCLSMKGSHWYGGSELLHQKWPLEKVSVRMDQYVPQDCWKTGSNSKDTYCSVLERYWLNSYGIAVVVDSNVPLHVSINENGNQKLCLKSDPTGYLGGPISRLTYRILSGVNLKSMHLKVVNDSLGKLKEIPPSSIIKYPIWQALGGGHHGNISQQIVEDLGKNIQSTNLPCSYIVIGGHYSGKYENFAFNSSTFPTPKTMIENLRSSGCNVSVHVHPYLKTGSREFDKANNEGYLVQSCGSKGIPGLIKWQNQLAACIDITSNKSKLWFKDQLETFQQEFLLSSFAFHNGDVTHLPFCFQFNNKSTNPGYFSQNYAQFAAQSKGLYVLVGYKSQQLPIFVKMTSKRSTWDGLKSLIPTVLTYGIMGYPYVLPSVIGGHDTSEAELYIRWVQASIFLPGMEFSKGPWSYSKEMFAIVKDLLKLRSDLYPVILDAFYNVTKTGAPIIRPLWWIAPRDKEAHVINSQFMLGDVYLVAPILEKGKKAQSVYLPVGKWQEMFKKRKIIDNKKDGGWEYYNVTLEDLLYFRCLALYD